jgi:hypothetical protein
MLRFKEIIQRSEIYSSINICGSFICRTAQEQRYARAMSLPSGDTIGVVGHMAPQIKVYYGKFNYNKSYRGRN